MYGYDVLNRLLGSGFEVYNGGSWSSGNGAIANYDEELSYDANGNIVSAIRDGVFDPVVVGTLMDNLTYQYDYGTAVNGLGRNRLRYVSDGVNTQTVVDLETQVPPFLPAGNPLPTPAAMNYEYDGSGNLVYDRSEGTLIKWNAQGKVAEVRKDQPWGISQTTRFWYNAAGNRVKKQVINHMAADPEESRVTYYVCDANEAVLAMYEQTVLHASGTPGCLRMPNNATSWDSDNDGVVDNPPSCDNCRVGMLGGFPGSSWNPWQEDYDRDGVGDACDPCPFHPAPPGSPCVGEPLPPMPEQWQGQATQTKLAELPIYGRAAWPHAPERSTGHSDRYNAIMLHAES